jgi:tripartite-type tricarboxylate transporter receptor subunit TctC
MDPALVERISADMAVVLKDPIVLKRLEDSGLSARYLNPQQLAAFMQAEMKKYGDIITRSNVQKQ